MNPSRPLVCAISALATVMLALAGQETNKLGLPNPTKPDVPFLIHASSLVEVEQSQATKETRKKEQLYTVPGASSGVTTPLASPEMLFLSENIDPPGPGVLPVRVEERPPGSCCSRKRRRSSRNPSASRCSLWIRVWSRFAWTKASSRASTA